MDRSYLLAGRFPYAWRKPNCLKGPCVQHVVQDRKIEVKSKCTGRWPSPPQNDRQRSKGLISVYKECDEMLCNDTTGHATGFTSSDKKARIPTPGGSIKTFLRVENVWDSAEV